jgi:hypothetical protein
MEFLPFVLFVVLILHLFSFLVATKLKIWKHVLATKQHLYNLIDM